MFEPSTRPAALIEPDEVILPVELKEEVIIAPPPPALEALIVTLPIPFIG